MQNELSCLASYVLYKHLYDEKKDVYFIISKFVENTIIEQKIARFTLQDITTKVNEEYGFDLPSYVIQTSTNKLDFVKKENHEFIVKKKIISKSVSTLDSKIKSEINKNTILVNSLYKFIEEQLEKSLSKSEMNKILSDFYSYLLDNNYSSEYSNLISAFILKNKLNYEIISQIEIIKQGIVLYAGMNFNDVITPQAKWNEELNVFRN